MNVPPGYTEAQVTDIIIMIGQRLSSKFTFGNYTQEDIRQEVAVAILAPDQKGLNSIAKYRPEVGPLENFLFSHARNRVCNLKRDKFQRLNKPCFKCPLKAYIVDNDECTAYCEKSECSLWSAWSLKNSAKRNVICPISIDCANDEDEDGMKILSEPVSAAETQELMDLIDSKLPSQYRHDYNKMLAGLKVARAKRVKIKAIIQEILGEAGDTDD